MSKALLGTDVFTNRFLDERVKALIPQFEELAPFTQTKRKKGNGDVVGWQELAIQEAVLLKQKYPDNSPEGEKMYNSATSQISNLKKYLKKDCKKYLKDQMTYYQVCTIITHFGEALSYLFREYKTVSNNVARKKAETRTCVENRVELDLTDYLKKAQTILEKAARGASRNIIDWKDVSCALALVTGRRMSEIHLSASFEIVSEYEVEFKGQLKGKTRKINKVLESGEEKKVKLINATFTIPTLVDSSLVVDGLEWLQDDGKRLESNEEPILVNNRWSKALSERVRSDWKLFDEMTYHKLRGAYFAACIENAQGEVQSVDFERYAVKVLCDNDPNTIQRYKQFTIKEGTLTKI